MKKDYDNHFIRNKLVIPFMFILLGGLIFMVNPIIGSILATIGLFVMLSQEPVED